MKDFNQPVKVEESKYRDLYREKISVPSGNFFIFDNYVVGEINEGVHFDWDIAKDIIQKVYLHFGTSDIHIAYVSNRVYSYSVQPKDWLNFYRDRHKLKCIAIVAYNKQGVLSLVLEKIFSKSPIRKFRTIDYAVDWAVNCDASKIKK